MLIFMSKRGLSQGLQKITRRRGGKKKKGVDINKLINIAVKTGETIIGTKRLKKYINTNDLKLIVLANNCPDEIRVSIELLAQAKDEPIEIFNYPFSSWDLGAAGGKPFMIAAMGIIKPGDSSILDNLEKIRKELGQ